MKFGGDFICILFGGLGFYSYICTCKALKMEV